MIRLFNALLVFLLSLLLDADSLVCLECSLEGADVSMCCIDSPASGTTTGSTSPPPSQPEPDYRDIPRSDRGDEPPIFKQD